MVCWSAPFWALMRRNALYRRRNFFATILELLLPVGFAAIVLAIKGALDDGGDNTVETVPAVIRSDWDVFVPLTFTDYVTAILAKRVCIARGDGEFVISGMPFESENWQVPFVKCDERRCQVDGEDAYDYCEYNFLAVAPTTAGDAAGKERALAFKDYIETRYPQLLDPSQTHFPADFEFVQEFESGDAIEKYVTTGDYGEPGFDKVALAVTFDGNDPDDWKYSLRVNSTNTNSWNAFAQPGSPTTPDTASMFSSYAKGDWACDVLSDEGNNDSSCTERYIYNGFLSTQRLLHDFVMLETGSKDNGYYVSEHGVRYVPFPVRPYTQDGVYTDLSEFLPLLLTLGILYPCASMISYIVQEKELRQKELLKMMGITDFEIGVSWFLSFWGLHIVTGVLVTLISAQLFPKSELVLLLIFWEFCFIGFVLLSMLLSTLTAKTTRGVMIGLLVVFCGYFLTLVADFETGNAGTISLVSIHPVAAMSYAVSEVGRLENLGVGLTTNTMSSTDSPSGYTFVTAYGNLIFSWIVMALLTWYLNRVIAPDYGQALPFYFPFTSSYWCGAKHTDITTDEAEDVADDGVPNEPVADLLKQQTKSGESIEIKNLRKDFGEKIAVDGLNLSMYSGQITALLGHNGAGKTTTISMLTGALSPTSGTATITGQDIRTEMSKIRGDIGICLQHDCLFPKLTVREHVQFFSRVKGTYGKMPHQDAEAEIDQAIRDVALEEKSNTYSSNLSGGMKRKLSVAIAFCGGSKVVFLDEPTSGMDPFSRRFSWNVIRQYRQDRCIILTTHFMDEADILGDRIAIMAEGRLRCCGSSLFLKKTYGVGYQLTIEKRAKNLKATAEVSVDEKIVEGASDEDIKDIVIGNVEDATLLSNVGTEISFQLPLGASASFVPMLERLDEESQKGGISAYGVSITTLDEVFQIVARGEDKNKHDFQSSHFSSKNLAAPAEDDEERSVRSRMDLDNEGLFGTHVQALIQKRAANFKRDKKAWCCTTILPSIFVLAGMLILKFAVPSRNLEPLPLDLNDYNENINVDPRNPIPYNTPESVFTCSPGLCMFDMSSINLDETDENYYFCGQSEVDFSKLNESCTINESENVVSTITDAGAVPEGGAVDTIYSSSTFILNQSALYEASQYGGIFLNHDQNSETSSGELYSAVMSSSCTNGTADYRDAGECELFGGIGYTVAYNFTALHASPMFQVLADEGIVREGTNNPDFKITATVAPLPITSKEDQIAEAIDAFYLWFLIVLSFPFILGAFATFIVNERESKAKHLQTVAGVKPSAYWISTLMWDFINYLIPAIITVILSYAFDVTTLTTTDRGVLGGFLGLLFFFGPAGAAFSYCVSFMFKSASLCNITLIVTGFLVSMGGTITVWILTFFGKLNDQPHLWTAAQIVTWILRFFPPFCLAKGLYFVMFITALDDLYGGKKLNAFDPEVMGIDFIFLVVESVLYLILAIQIDILSSNPEVMALFQKLCCCRGSSDRSAVAAIPDDDDVVAEQERVLNGEANNDAIVMSELTKIYPNGKIAVNKLSLGIPPGECFGLLGINGAGKTTTMGMLTAEFPPTEGDATLAGFSLRHEPEKTRRRIGYCPQFDAHFENMSGREHVELYASIKGIPADSVKAAAADKLAQVGLSEKDSDRLSSNYSGGMKRRLSLACATIGQPQLVFLDECSTGVDPVARREIWQLVSDLVSAEVEGGQKTSVILTTHSMDECEALCPRIGIMANGKLRCLGSAQQLKTKFGKGYQLELKVAATVKDDDDFKANFMTVAKAKGVEFPDEEQAPAEDLAVFFNLGEAQTALHQLTGDDYLSSMLNEANPTGYGVFKDASSAIGVSLSDLTSFAVNELRMRSLGAFVSEAYPSAVLRERQDMKARFEVSSEGVSIAQIFASIEESKEKLKLSDYGVSQTSLEQVFNMHAAEAERLKQGRMDG